MPEETIIPQVWSTQLGDLGAILGFPPEPEPLMPVRAWLFVMEQYATEVANQKMVIHPETVLRWLEHMKDDHPELED